MGLSLPGRIALAPTDETLLVPVNVMDDAPAVFSPT